MQRIRARIGALLFCGFAAVAFCGFAAAGAGETAKVRQVLDGDSLMLADGRQVRLIGINTPEFGRDRQPNQPLAEAARAFTASQVENRDVRLEFDHEHQDHYGRTLAYVRLADNDTLQERLLTRGLGWTIAVPPNLARLARLQQAERVARTSNIGVWNETALAPQPADTLDADDAGFLLVEGRVRKIHRSQSAIDLDLADRMSVRVPRADWRHFPHPPEHYLGKRLVARGWLTEHRQRFYLRVSHPAMLDVGNQKIMTKRFNTSEMIE